MTPDDLPTQEKQRAVGMVRTSFGLLCACVAMTLLCAGLVVFVGAPRSALMLISGVTALNGLMHLRVMRLADAIDQETTEG